MDTYRLTADQWHDGGDRPDELVPRPATTALDDLIEGPTDLSAEALIDAHLPLAELVATLADQEIERRDALRGVLGVPSRRPPLVVAVTGGVAVGKSMTAKVLRSILVASGELRIDVVSTDGFLFSNQELDQRGLLPRKGFPESYDHDELVTFLAAIKAGERRVPAPIYDHVTYDVLRTRVQIIDAPDVLILEGVNVLQPVPSASASRLLVSDFLDYSVYVDADEPNIRAWFLQRLHRLRAESATDPTSFFAQFSGLTDREFAAIGESTWDTVNRPNLEDHIAPSRFRADLVIEKAADHSVRGVLVRNH
jgi:type I pantothenate kinase